MSAPTGATRGGSALADISVVFITFLAPFLAGSILLWSKALIVLLMSVVMLVWPARRLPSRGILWTAAGLFLLALTGLLPSALLPDFPGRAELTALGVPLSASHAPQFWITLESVMSLLAYLTWGGYLLVRDWHYSRGPLLTYFALGVAAMTWFTMACHWMHWIPSFWPAIPDLGPFRNPNHSSNFFALGGLVLLSVGWWNWRHGHRWGLFFLGTFVLCGHIAFVLDSRGGLILYFMGPIAWIIGSFCLRQKGPAWAIGTSIGMFLLSLLLLFGGRGEGAGPMMELGANGMISHDARALLHQKVLTSLPKIPFNGVGLGQFKQIYNSDPIQQLNPTTEGGYSPDLFSFHHPESDWLWGAFELGALGPLLVLLMVGLVLKQLFPLNRGSYRNLRLTCAIAVGLFLLHGVVDVPGHLAGTLAPALFLLAMAVRGEVGGGQLAVGSREEEGAVGGGEEEGGQLSVVSCRLSAGRRGKLAVGSWRLAVGSCRLAVGKKKQQLTSDE